MDQDLESTDFLLDGTHSSRLASSATMAGALPPSSSTTGFRYLPQVCAMIEPTRVEPVKLHVQIRVSRDGVGQLCECCASLHEKTQQDIGAVSRQQLT